MPQTVRQGSSGPEVMVLQAQLNLFFKDKAPLVVDGLFGPLTRGRTVAFQQARGLSADGIVGPMTWGALAKIAGDGSVHPQACSCGNGLYENRSRGDQYTAMLKGGAGGGSSFAPRSGPAPGFAFASFSGGGGGASALAAPAISIGGVTLTPITATAHKATVDAVFGTSLHYDRIFLSNQTGAQNRPFTIAVPVPPLLIGSLPFGGHVQVLNVGTSPSNDTMIHESGHAWQSQHHSDALQYMKNCIACQAAAVAANGIAGQVDASVTSHKDYPVNYPFSAYAYTPGSSFGTYGGEQIAQQIENNETAIRTHASGIGAGVVDKDNKDSVDTTNVKIADRRVAGVKM